MKQKISALERGYSKVLPAVFTILALVIMFLPLQSIVVSTRSILTYIFIPQIRASHRITQYTKDALDSTKDLLNTADKNLKLREEVSNLLLENAQLESLFAENKRLTESLQISSKEKWKGLWAKVAYREPSRRGTIIVDKGSQNGISLRAPVIAIDQGKVGLVGKVIEVSPTTSKILLSSDEDFSVAAFLSESKKEGLALGDAKGGMFIKYITLGQDLTEGEKVFTSISSAIFPDGILIGYIGPHNTQKIEDSFITAKIVPVVDSNAVNEVLIMPALNLPLGEIKK
ncbi:MAG: rod shape-determining protein MreC [Elusimicrobiaceae bacterium]|nr:rod shape-determining protein MreC [Elusimicrobiaceae bacterium]